MKLQDKAYETEQTEEMGARYLTFRTDGQLFGIPITQIVQITQIQEIIELPEHPHYVKGIINLRGQIIPVIDVRLRFGKPEAPHDERTCIIITRVRGSNFGLIVDEVDEVADIRAEQVSEPPKINADADLVNTYLTGIAKLQANGGQHERVALLLAVANLLKEQEVVSLSQAAEELA